MNIFETISEFDEMMGVECLHPLVSVVNFAEAKPMRHMRHVNGFYSVMLKDEVSCKMIYGRSRYDYDKGSVVFTAPGQVLGIEDASGEVFQPAGWGLFFHPDLIRGTELAGRMKEYSFFSYQMNEALHLSERERTVFLHGLIQVQNEISRDMDRLSKRLIVSNIEIVLDHCLRFYERQFVARESMNHDLLNKFEDLLTAYFESDRVDRMGLPTVRYFANELCLSSNYFGDLMKKETGRSPQEHIHSRLLDEVKNRLHDPTKSIARVAEELGFQYPQHLTVFFKKKTGMTPYQYRVQLA